MHVIYMIELCNNCIIIIYIINIEYSTCIFFMIIAKWIEVGWKMCDIVIAVNSK